MGTRHQPRPPPASDPLTPAPCSQVKGDHAVVLLRSVTVVHPLAVLLLCGNAGAVGGGGRGAAPAVERSAYDSASMAALIRRKYGDAAAAEATLVDPDTLARALLRQVCASLRPLESMPWVLKAPAHPLPIEAQVGGSSGEADDDEGEDDSSSAGGEEAGEEEDEEEDEEGEGGGSAAAGAVGRPSAGLARGLPELRVDSWAAFAAPPPLAIKLLALRTRLHRAFHAIVVSPGHLSPAESRTLAADAAAVDVAAAILSLEIEHLALPAAPQLARAESAPSSVSGRPALPQASLGAQSGRSPLQPALPKVAPPPVGPPALKQQSKSAPGSGGNVPASQLHAAASTLAVEVTEPPTGLGVSALHALRTVMAAAAKAGTVPHSPPLPPTAPAYQAAQTVPEPSVVAPPEPPVIVRPAAVVTRLLTPSAMKAAASMHRSSEAAGVLAPSSAPAGSAVPAASLAQRCMFWNNSGECKFGNACRYFHGSANEVCRFGDACRDKQRCQSRHPAAGGGGATAVKAAPAAARPTPVGGTGVRGGAASSAPLPARCKQWDNSGHCKFGSSCRYFHGTSNAPCRFGDACHGKPQCQFRHPTPTTVVVATRDNPGLSSTRAAPPAGVGETVVTAAVTAPQVARCKPWNNSGDCKFGSSCKFRHGTASVPCEYGDLCRDKQRCEFRHPSSA